MARISELHYSNAYAASSGVSEFIEISLAVDEDPEDFSVAFYQANGTVGLVVTLDDLNVIETYDSQSDEMVYVISADNFNIALTDPDGGGSGNYEAYALVDTTDGTVVDFYDIGGGTTEIEALDGPAMGAVSTNLPVLTGPNSTTTTLQFNLPDPDTLTHDTVSPGETGIVCFVRGTRLDTEKGETLVEELRIGDLVRTHDNGLQPIRWIGKRTVRAEGNFAPVLIRPGVINNLTPLLVSPQHRVMVTGADLEYLFGTDEALVAAKHLIDGKKVFQRHGGLVTYYHVMFEGHELVRSNGALSESFYVSANSLAMLCPDARAEFATLFPGLFAQVGPAWPMARPTLRAHEAMLLARAA